MNRPALLRVGLAAAVLPLVPALPASASAVADVKTTYENFIKAQNDKDPIALKPLLWDSTESLYITKFTPLRGRDVALGRFNDYWKTTWKLKPVDPPVVTMQSADSAFVYAPIEYTIGPNDAEAKVTVFLLNLSMLLVKDRWVITSIVPVPKPPPAVAK